jgi:hypothetical protein
MMVTGSPETSVHFYNTMRSRNREGTRLYVKYLCSKVKTYEGCYVRMLRRNVRRNLVLIGLRRVAYVAGLGGRSSACCFLEGGHLEKCLIIYSVISKVEVTVNAYI